MECRIIPGWGDQFQNKYTNMRKICIYILFKLSSLCDWLARVFWNFAKVCWGLESKLCNKSDRMKRKIYRKFSE